MKLFRPLLFASIAVAFAFVLAPPVGLSPAAAPFYPPTTIATADAGTMLTNAGVADVMRIVSVALLMVAVSLVFFALAVSAGRFSLLRQLIRHSDPLRFSGLHRSPPG